MPIVGATVPNDEASVPLRGGAVATAAAGKVGVTWRDGCGGMHGCGGSVFGLLACGGL